jgi:hypothetical protein
MLQCHEGLDCECWIPFGYYFDPILRPAQSLFFILVVRFSLCLVFAGKTHHPDQNWQGLEIAYNMAYSDVVSVVLSWEWAGDYALRNTLYPLYLSLPLHILRLLRIDTNFLVVNSMLLMNCLLQVVGDYFLYMFAHQLFGKKGAKITLITSVFSCKINLIFSKTLTNGAESAFSMCGLYFYSKLGAHFDKNMAYMTLSITLAFIVRSSSAIGWVPLALLHFFSARSNAISTLEGAIFVALPTFLVSFIIDVLHYGKVTCPQVNFVKLNVIDDLSRHFGVDCWFTYLEKIPGYFFSKPDDFKLSLLGLSLISIMQAKG